MVDPARAQSTDVPSTRASERGQATRAGSSWSAALLALLVAATYARILWGELVYDDLDVVARNPLITSFAHLGELFSSALWDFLDPAAAHRVGYWRPMASLALVLGYKLGGGEPWAFHVLSLVFHVAATIFAWRLALRLSRSPATAFFAALLFGLHPVHVESVAWISALNDPLFGMFALASLDSFVRWREEGSVGSAWKVAVWFLAALLSKELAIAVLPVALVLDLALRMRDRERGNASPPRWRAAYGPLVAALSAYWLLRVLVFGDLGAGFDRTTTDFGVTTDRLLLLRAELLGGFLWLLAWPFELNLFRPFRPSLPISDPELLRGLACIAVALAGLGFAWKRRRAVSFALLAFTLAALFPPLARVSALGTFPLSERFLYLAVFGFTGWLAHAAISLAGPRFGAALLALVALAYGVRSFDRIAFWHDEHTLFTSAAAASPRSPTVQWGLGRVLLQRYKEKQDGNALLGATKAFEDSLDLLAKAQQGDASIFATRDDHVQANLGLAWSHLFETEYGPFTGDETAYRVFKRIVDRYPSEAQAHTGLGAAAMALGKLDEADASMRRATEINPRYVEGWHNLGLLEMRRERWNDAARDFERALELRPDHLDDLLWLARARTQAGDLARAREALDRAKRRYPEEPGPMVLEATLAAQKGDFEGALAAVARALEKDPDDGEAMLLRGKLLAARGERAGAERAFMRATELLTKSFEAHYNAGAMVLQSTSPAAAMPYLIRAYELRPENEAGQRLAATLAAIDVITPDQLWQLAAIDSERGADDQALMWLDRALAADPKHGPSHYSKGTILQKRGDKEGAVRELRLAVEAMPQSFPAHEALGSLLADLGRDDEALPLLDRAYALAQETEGRTPEGRAALEAMKKAIEEVRNRSK